MERMRAEQSAAATTSRAVFGGGFQVIVNAPGAWEFEFCLWERSFPNEQTPDAVNPSTAVAKGAA